MTTVDYKRLARKYARQEGLDPYIYQRQVGKESNFNPAAKSPAGALGINQFMPDTAKGLGINPSDPDASLRAGAHLMAGYVKKYGSYEAALRAYNAGPGAIEKSKGFGETNNYVKAILQGRDPRRLGSTQVPDMSNVSSRASSSGQLPGTTQDTSTAPTVYDVIRRYNDATTGQETPGTSALDDQLTQSQDMLMAAIQRQNAPDSTAPSVGVADMGTAGEGGGQNALAWATSKLGNKETGANTGGLASYANQRFGMRGQPWCAMFTSLAVTKGGAPSNARTASVAEVLRKAQAGDGYVKGFIHPSQARPGDLITFGTRHIGMVEGVNGDEVTMVAGNDSNQVQRRAVKLGRDMKIVRPAYSKGN